MIAERIAYAETIDYKIWTDETVPTWEESKEMNCDPKF
jgi:hypothetical protein